MGNTRQISSFGIGNKQFPLICDLCSVNRIDCYTYFDGMRVSREYSLTALLCYWINLLIRGRPF